MSNLKPTYQLALKAFQTEKAAPDNHELVKLQSWFYSLPDEQLAYFFESCHNEWLFIIEKYLDSLSEWYLRIPGGELEMAIHQKLMDHYKVVKSLMPDMEMETLSESTCEGFETWAACVYLTNFSELRQGQMGRLITMMSGILFLKKLLECKDGKQTNETKKKGVRKVRT
jgi:hypothetical protein